MTQGAERQPAGGIELACGLVFAIAWNLFYLDPRIVGVNDTFYNLANFQIFYSELAFHGDLARWLPYGTYGLQADYEQLASLSPFAYLVGAIGALLRVSDAVLLFKLAAIAEQMVFVFGVWRLARGLFTERATVAALAIAAAGTSVWYAQQWWDFRIYALLPLLLSFLFEFVETKRPARLWLAGLTGIIWCLGGLPYWIPVWVLTLATIGVVAVRDWRATLRSLARQDAREWALFACFALAAAAYAWFVLHALDGATLRATDRDPLTGKVDLENFRSYGGNADLLVVASALFFGWPLHLPWGSGADNSVYLGLLPLLGLAVALRHERGRIFFALGAAVLVLVLLSLGGIVTTLVYHLPGFAYYRHVALTFGIVKVLLLIASGYGLDRVFARGGPKLVTPLVGAVLAIVAIEALVATSAISGAQRWDGIGGWGVHVLLRLNLYAALLAIAGALSLSRARLVLVALALDLAIYQGAVHQKLVPKIADTALLEAVRATPVRFQPERRDAPPDPESQRAVDLAEATKSREVYWFVYQLASFDPCRPKLRTDYHQAGVMRLLALDRKGAPPIDALLGCDVAKLRVAERAQIAHSTDEARTLLRESLATGDHRPTVIEAPSGAASPDGVASGSVAVRSFTLDELVAEVQVDAPDGAWLVYDDAFHAGWRASVNGVETPILAANLAWKAVRVPSGASTVRFWFRHGANHGIATGIAVVGLAAAVGLVGWIVASLVRGRSR